MVTTRWHHWHCVIPVTIRYPFMYRWEFDLNHSPLHYHNNNNNHKRNVLRKRSIQQFNSKSLGHGVSVMSPYQLFCTHRDADTSSPSPVKKSCFPNPSSKEMKPETEHHHDHHHFPQKRKMRNDPTEDTHHRDPICSSRKSHKRCSMSASWHWHFSSCCQRL